MGRQAVLLLARHLAEGAVMALWQEHRIVAEAGSAPWRPDQRALHDCLELLEMAVGPGDAERGHKLRLAQRRAIGGALSQFGIDGLHGMAEVLSRSGPARGMDTGRTA